ncbi:putative phosphatidylinositol 3-kinase [Helianthus anomalus]
MLPSLDIGNGVKDKKLYVKCAVYIDGAPFWLPMKTRLESSSPPFCWVNFYIECQIWRLDYQL